MSRTLTIVAQVDQFLNAVLLAGLLLLLPASVSAQAVARTVNAASLRKAKASTSSSPKPWVAPHTRWGDPDIQGVWDGAETLPLERPAALGDKEFFTDEELVDRVTKAAARAKARQTLVAQGKVEHEGFRAVPNYNAIFGYSESEAAPKLSKRTSAIIDPPDGRLPAWTLEQVKYWETREAATKGRGESDSMDDINLNTRCISVVSAPEVTNWGLGFGGANATAPGRPDASIVGEDVDVGDGIGVNASSGAVRRILQSRGYVAFVMGDMPVYRIVPLDGHPHPSSKIREWMGDARGHWEGDTLVVDIANIQYGSPIIPNYGGSLYPGSGETLHVIERFTRIAADRLEYRYTIDDPHVYVRPYTALHTLRKDGSRGMATSVCREDTKDRGNFLSNARADEAGSLDSGEDSVNARKVRFNQLKQDATSEAGREHPTKSSPGASSH